MKRWIVCFAVVGMMAAGCGEQKKVEMGPEETVEAFCRAVAGGDFETAMSLCDSLSMKEYVDGYVRTLDMLKQRDSSAVAIASAVVAEAEFIFEDTVKEGDSRHIFYRMSLDSREKKKLAILKKEEGAWKVETIIDRP